MSLRRYYLAKRREAQSQGFGAIASAWRAKQEAEPGIALGSAFPASAALEAAGYTTHEDLNGATLEELQRAGLRRRDALAVLAAL